MRPYTTEYAKLTQADWLRVFSKLSATRLHLHIIFAIVGVAVAICGFAIGVDDRVGRIIAVSGFGILGAAIGDRVYFYWAIKKHLSDPQNDKLLAEARATVDETGIKLESKSGVTTFYPWEMIIRTEDTGDMRLLYIGKSSAIVMQDRSHTPEDWESLAGWISARVANRS
jgi:hypothetical protein